MSFKLDDVTPSRTDDDSTDKGLVTETTKDTVLEGAQSRSAVTGAPFNNIPYFYNNSKYGQWIQVQIPYSDKGTFYSSCICRSNPFLFRSIPTNFASKDAWKDYNSKYGITGAMANGKVEGSWNGLCGSGDKRMPFGNKGAEGVTTLPNCVGWVWSRLRELYWFCTRANEGKGKLMPAVTYVDGSTWYRNIGVVDGWYSLANPVPGAVVDFDNGHHSAIVEAVISDTICLISESSSYARPNSDQSSMGATSLSYNKNNQGEDKCTVSMNYLKKGSSGWKHMWYTGYTSGGVKHNVTGIRFTGNPLTTYLAGSDVTFESGSISEPTAEEIIKWNTLKSQEVNKPIDVGTKVSIDWKGADASNRDHYTIRCQTGLRGIVTEYKQGEIFPYHIMSEDKSTEIGWYRHSALKIVT